MFCNEAFINIYIYHIHTLNFKRLSILFHVLVSWSHWLNTYHLITCNYIDLESFLVIIIVITDLLVFHWRLVNSLKEIHSHCPDLYSPVCQWSHAVSHRSGPTNQSLLTLSGKRRPVSVSLLTWVCQKDQNHNNTVGHIFLCLLEHVSLWYIDILTS